MKEGLKDACGTFYRTFNFEGKTVTLGFWVPLGDLGATYAVHLKLIGKSIVGLDLLSC